MKWYLCFFSMLSLPVAAQEDSANLDLVNYFQIERTLWSLDSTEISLKRSLSNELKYKEFREKAKPKMEDAVRKLDAHIDRYPYSQTCLFALRDKGCLEMKLGDLDLAEKTIYKLLERCRKDTSLEDFSQRGLMNYGVRSLANLYICAKDYRRALSLLDSLKLYPRTYMCPSAGSEDQLSVNQMYGMCYIGLSQTKKGLSLLVPQILDPSEPFDSSHVDLTFSVLVKLYKKEELRRSFNESLSDYRLRQNAGTKKAHFKFLGYHIKPDPASGFETEEIEIEEARKDSKYYFKNLKFYRLLFG